MKTIISDMRKILIIDRDKCLSCCLCVDACTCKLLEMEEDFPRPRKDRIGGEEQIGEIYKYVAPTCANCRVCIITCPQEAIEILAHLQGTNCDDNLPESSRIYPRGYLSIR